MKAKLLLPFPRLIFTCVLLSIFFLGCQKDNDIATVSQQQLIVIGEDLSQTFKNFTPITTEDLRDVCNALQKNKTGGKIIVVGIGSSTPKGHVSCILKPIMPIDKRKPVSDQLKTKQKNSASRAKNEEAINDFLEKADAIIQQRNQPFTDINGFLEKASYLMDAPGFENHVKWLYVNSDGKQDTQKSKKVDCSQLPTVDQFCVSGWKNKPDCGPTSRFLAPSDFIDYLKSQL